MDIAQNTLCEFIGFSNPFANLQKIKVSTNLLRPTHVIEIMSLKGTQKSKVMDTKDTKEEKTRRNYELENEAAQRLRAEGKVRKNNGTRKVNKLWLWLGVLILIFILLWWLYSIGTFEALSGVTNG